MARKTKNELLADYKSVIKECITLIRKQCTLELNRAKELTNQEIIGIIKDTKYELSKIKSIMGES